MKTKEGEKKQRPLPTEKQHLALCNAVIDFGTQESKFGSARKVWINFETPNEKAVFDEEKGPQPFTVGSEYTFSLDPKANFRKMLDSWLGAPVPEIDSEKLGKLLRRAGMVQIIHEKSDKDGLVYAKIANKGTSIFKRPADVAAPKETENMPIFFDLDNFSQETFDAIPMKWMKEKIMKSPEYRDAVMSTGTAQPSASTSVEGEDEPF